jgi:WXG100 family type VII secretion target
MSGISANFGTISDTGSQTASLASSLQDRFTQLMTDAKGILQDGWNGAAADMFQQAQAKWNQEAGELANSHGQLGRAVSQFGEDLHQTDTGPASAVFNI